MGAARYISDTIMASHVTRRSKPGLSDRQKQTLFLTVTAVGLSVLFITLVLWSIDRPGF